MKKLQITGHLGSDARVNTNQATGVEYANFSVGVTVGTKDNPKTDWVEVSCGGKHLDLVKYFKKGCKVLVEGFPDVDAYVSKEDNKIKAVQKLFAYQIEILTFKADEAENADKNISMPVENNIATINSFEESAIEKNHIV